MNKLLSASIIVGSSLLFSTANALPTIKMQVNGLVCAFCAQGIEKKLKALPQTKGVFVSLKHKVVALELKDGTEIQQPVLDKLIKDAGYVLTKTERLDHPIEHIKADVMSADK